MVVMDESWMNLPRYSDEYKRALNVFLDDYFAKRAIGKQIDCPCKKCVRRYWLDRQEVYDHLVVDGFVKGIKQWLQTEESCFGGNARTYESNAGQKTCDDIDGLLHETFKDTTTGGNQGVRDGPNEEARKFYELVEDGNQELYPGCETFSKLSFIIHLYLFKCDNGLSNAAFDDLMELLRKAFPEARLPKSFNEAKTTLGGLGLDYRKIHECLKDCMSYWKEHEGANSCHERGCEESLDVIATFDSTSKFISQKAINMEHNGNMNSPLRTRQKKRALSPARTTGNFEKVQQQNEPTAQVKEEVHEIQNDQSRSNPQYDIVSQGNQAGNNELPHLSHKVQDPNKKHRGPTKLIKVHRRKLEERVAVFFNDKNKPVGPSDKEFIRFLGTIAHDCTWAPLTYISWHKVPNKERMWEYVNSKYIIPATARKWVLKKIGAAWRNFKCHIKENHYYKYDDNTSRWDHRPDGVPPRQFKALLQYWNSSPAKKISQINSWNRDLQDNMQTIGPKSFTSVFNKLERMNQIEASEEGSIEICEDQAEDVMKEDHPGRLHLLGRGDSCKNLKGKEVGTPMILPSEASDSKKILTADLDAEKEAMEGKSGELQAEAVVLSKEMEVHSIEVADLKKLFQAQADRVAGMQKELQARMENMASEVSEMVFAKLKDTSTKIAIPELIEQAIVSSADGASHQ